MITLEVQELDAAEVYERVLPAMIALPKEAVRRPNLEIMPAVGTALGILPHLRPLRERLAKLVEFDIGCVDHLEDYSLALSHADALFRSSFEAHDDLPALLQEATAIKERLLADAEALAKRNLLDRSRLRKLTGWSGYKHVSFDLLTIVLVLKDSWSEIAGKCGVGPAELDHADRLAARMIRLVGLRKSAPSSRADARDLRARAFTLFIQAYEQAQRGVAFLLFGHPDCDLVVPCLYSKGGARRRKPRAKTDASATALSKEADPLPVSKQRDDQRA